MQRHQIQLFSVNTQVAGPHCLVIARQCKAMPGNETLAWSKFIFSTPSYARTWSYAWAIISPIPHLISPIQRAANIARLLSILQFSQIRLTSDIQQMIHKYIQKVSTCEFFIRLSSLLAPLGALVVVVFLDRSVPSIPSIHPIKLALRARPKAWCAGPRRDIVGA